MRASLGAGGGTDLRASSVPLDDCGLSVCVCVCVCVTADPLI